MMDEEDSITAEIILEIPGQRWISYIFDKYTDVELDILNYLPYNLHNSIGNAIAEISHVKVNQIIEDIRNHPSVIDFCMIKQEETRVKFNILTKNPYLFQLAIKCGVMIIFPVRVRNRSMKWKLISSRKRIDNLLTLLEKRNLNFSISEIGISPDYFNEENCKLALKKSKLLETAVNLGFFDIPRKISLAELANRLGKSKSALSVMLRKIVKEKLYIEAHSFDYKKEKRLLYP